MPGIDIWEMQGYNRAGGGLPDSLVSGLAAGVLQQQGENYFQRGQAYVQSKMGFLSSSNLQYHFNIDKTYGKIPHFVVIIKTSQHEQEAPLQFLRRVLTSGSKIVMSTRQYWRELAVWRHCGAALKISLCYCWQCYFEGLCQQAIKSQAREFISWISRWDSESGNNVM